MNSQGATFWEGGWMLAVSVGALLGDLVYDPSSKNEQTLCCI